MHELGIDIETQCDMDLADGGVYRYVESPRFRVLLFGYSIDGAPAEVVDLDAGEEIPREVLAALTDAGVVKTAWNAQFERVALSRYLGMPVGSYLDPAQWRCTMAQSARLGFPLALGQAASVMKLAEGKMEEGRALIRRFSKVKAEEGGDLLSSARVPYSESDPERWATFKAYCRRDVDVEQTLLRRMRGHAVPPWEEELYVADQLINDRGVAIDRRLVESAARLDEEIKARLLEEMRSLTGVANPNSPTQLKAYIAATTGSAVTTLDRRGLDELEVALGAWPEVVRVIGLRRELAKTSNKKYEAMLKCVGTDGRIRGLLQYYGAARTGRWAGRLVQVQNLPQNHIPDLDMARGIVRRGDLDELELNYAEPTRIISELVRTAFVAPEGWELHVCDFSAIEARVVAWLAREMWVLDVFREGGDIYCATASRMFGVPVEKHGPYGHLRQKGKIATLALGYGGGVAALEAMGGARMGLTEAEMRETVYKWRQANGAIVKFWSLIERSAQRVLTDGGSITLPRGIVVERSRGALMVTLPSGRRLVYPRARMGMERGDGSRGDHPVIEHEGVNQTSRKWETCRTYGGKLTENIVQAVARDILARVVLRCREEGMRVAFHVHDEVVIEAPVGTPLSRLEALFSETPPWAPDMPLKGAGYVTPYYRKD